MTENLLDSDLNRPLNQKKNIDQYSFGVQYMIWLGLFLGCFILAQLISGSLILMYYQSADMKQIAADAHNLNTLRYAQMFGTLVSFLLPALIFSKLKDSPVTKYSNANIGFPIWFLILVPLLLITFYPIINVTFFLNKWLGFDAVSKGAQSEYKMLVEALLKGNSIFVFALNMITIAFLPAIAEEWIFRGTLQKLLSERLNIHLAVFIASVFFSLIHFEFSGFLPRIVLGMFLGYLFYYSGSLWTSVFAHAVNNGSQVVFMYLNNRGIYKMDVDNPEMPKIWELIVYTVVFAGLWYVFYHFAQKRKISNFAG